MTSEDIKHQLIIIRASFAPEDSKPQNGRRGHNSFWGFTSGGGYLPCIDSHARWELAWVAQVFVAVFVPVNILVCQLIQLKALGKFPSINLVPGSSQDRILRQPLVSWCPSVVVFSSTVPVPRTNLSLFVGHVSNDGADEEQVRWVGFGLQWQVGVHCHRPAFRLEQYTTVTSTEDVHLRKRNTWPCELSLFIMTSNRYTGSGDSSVVRAPDSWSTQRSWVRVPAGAAGEFSYPGSTFCADFYFGIRSTYVPVQWHVKDLSHFGKRAGGRLQLKLSYAACTLRMWLHLPWSDETWCMDVCSTATTSVGKKPVCACWISLFINVLHLLSKQYDIQTKLYDLSQDKTRDPIWCQY